MPAKIAAKLLEMGRVIDPPKTVALYAPLQQKEPYQSVKIERDVKYGAADRNLLDYSCRDRRISPAGADLCPWRRVCGRQQAKDADQSVL